jgi:hypothetical protein
MARRRGARARGCGCICNHDPRVIVAMNQAKAARLNPAPADTGPIPF